MEKKQKRWLIASAIAGMAAASYYALHKLSELVFDGTFLRDDNEVNDDYLDYFDTVHIEKLSLENKQGLLLSGSYIRNPKESKFILILIHGYHRSGFALKEEVEAFLNDTSCDIFIPDLRGHGDSEGDYVGFGCLDALDVKEWIDFLVAIYPEKPIAILGVSMGGATVCQLSSMTLPKEVRCLIEDCGYDTLYNQLRNTLLKEHKIPIFLISSMLNRKMRKRIGYSFNEARPIDHVEKATLPMMFIHGLKDDYVDSSMVFNLYNACSTEKELFYVKDAGHARSFKEDKNTYLHTVKDFINRYID